MNSHEYDASKLGGALSGDLLFLELSLGDCASGEGETGGIWEAGVCGFWFPWGASKFFVVLEGAAELSGVFVRAVECCEGGAGAGAADCFIPVTGAEAGAKWSLVYGLLEKPYRQPEGAWVW